MTETAETAWKTADQRLVALARVQEAFPNLERSQMMNIVDWAFTGGQALDAAALVEAAKKLAASNSADWNHHRDTQNKYLGLATQTVTAYFAALQK